MTSAQLRLLKAVARSIMRSDHTPDSIRAELVSAYEHIDDLDEEAQADGS